MRELEKHRLAHRLQLLALFYIEIISAVRAIRKQPRAGGQRRKHLTSLFFYL